jgi:hypothetical protein
LKSPVTRSVVNKRGFFYNFFTKKLPIGAATADMVAMSEFTAWKIAGSAIMFLIACAWNNWRTGYRMVAGSANALPDASPIWTPTSRSVTSHESSFTQQLINLHLALGMEPVEATVKPVAVRSR